VALQWAEMRMVRWIYGVKLKYRVLSKELCCAGGVVGLDVATVWDLGPFSWIVPTRTGVARWPH